MGKLDGKVAAITGGTRSIGRAMAEAFLREGAKVVVNGRDEAKGAQAVAEMGGGDDVAFYAGDASKQSTNEGIVDFAVERFGQLDIMCLNSGGVLNTAPVAMMSDEEWALEIDWNLNSVFWGMRKALQHMQPARQRAHHRHVVGRGQARQAGHPRLRGHQARGERPREGGGAGERHHRGSRSTRSSPA